MNLLLKYIDIIYFYNKRKIIRLKLFEKLSGKSLNDFFKSFCAGKPEMESKQFSKLIKECKLTEKKFGINVIDIFFAKVKSCKVKTITFA